MTLQEILDKHSTLIHKDHVPSIVREWLTQKRQEAIEWEKTYITPINYVTFYNELLEGLNQ